MSKKFTQDWFDRRIPIWQEMLSEFKGKPDLRFIEIGSYEGRSACWLMDNILTDKSSTLTCVDMWLDSGTQGPWSQELYDNYNMIDVFLNFNTNISEYKNKIIIITGRSQEVLRKFQESYDFIYIDGSHIACDVLEDAVLSFRLLKLGGIMALDDYQWEFFDDPRRHPKMGIDAFLAIFKGQYEILLKDQQVFIRKVKI